MSDSIQHYKKLLFTYPTENIEYKTYAIVDSIRDEHIKEKMVFTELNHLDLWDEALYENPQKVPLFLIELEEEDSLTPWLIENHGKNSTIYFQSSYDIKTLQAYYSRFTFPYVEMKAKGYDDEIPRGVFGFYDPKVLPDYMQTLYTQEKREEIFAGVSVYFSPNVDNGNGCKVYYMTEKGVAYRELNMSKEFREINVVSSQMSFVSLSEEKIPSIDAKQIAIFERLAHEHFVKEVLTDLYDEGSLTQSVETLLPKALHTAQFARTLGIDSQANMARFIQVGMTLPKSTEEYIHTKEFKAIQDSKSQAQKRTILEQILQEMKLKEVA